MIMIKIIFWIGYHKPMVIIMILVFIFIINKNDVNDVDDNHHNNVPSRIINFVSHHR